MNETAHKEGWILSAYRNHPAREEAGFRALIDRNADGMLIIDEAGIIRFANPAAADVFRRPPASLVGQDFGFPLATGDKTEIDLLLPEADSATAEMRVAEVLWEGASCHLVSLRDITERKRAQERVAHLNDVLRAIRNVNQLIVREPDRNALIQEACRLLVETRGYHYAWIALFREGRYVSSVVQAGLGDTFSEVENLLRAVDLRDEVAPPPSLPSCVRRVLNTPGVLATESPLKACPKCPLSDRYTDRGALSVRLQHREDLLGILTVSTPRQFVADKEEQALFTELANDLSFGLHTIASENQRRVLERVVNRSPAVAFVWRAREDWPVSYVSDNIEQFGYSPDEFYAKAVRFAEIIHPEDLERVAHEVMTYVQQGINRFEQEYRILTSDGETRWITDHTWVRRDEDGRVIEYEGIILDITERKTALEALRRQTAVETAVAELSRALLRSAPLEDISRIVLERATSLTNSTLGYVGYIDPTTGHLVCPTMTGEVWERCRVQDKDIVFGEFGGLWGWVLNHREPLLTNAPSDDPRSSSVPEGHLPIHRFLSVPALAGGKLVGQIALANAPKDYGPRDLALVQRLAGLYALAVQRHEALRALRDSERRYRALFEHAGDAIFVASPDGELLDVNQGACELIGYDREALLAKKPTEILTDEEAAERTGRFVDLQEDGYSVFPATARRRDGTTVPVEISARRIDYDGRPAILGIARDVTERREAQRRIQRYAADLKRSNQELEQFAYVASHDLREPLRTIKSYLELLQRRFSTELDAKAEQYINYAVEGAQRMQDMIQALLNLSRVETQGQPFVATDCDLLLNRTVSSLRPAIEEAGGTVTSNPLPTVGADPAQLSQVFQNLIANALKFQRPDVPPTVHVSADLLPVPEDDGASETIWRFSVRDNGIGMPADQNGRIFEVFQRLHTEEEFPGLGLGLALCKRIVERHGGHIWAKSELGHGSTFYFTLPVRESSPAASSSQAVDTPGSDPHGSEDDPGTRPAAVVENT